MSLLDKLLDETAGRKDRGIVTLIGPPQWGKTHSIADWSKRNNREVIRLLAQTMEPEAICGYDVKHPTTGNLQWAAPSWLRTILEGKRGTKYTLFLDELDKSREATLTSLLTLLCDRMVQNCLLPDTVAIVCAMNVPRAPLPPALVERLLFVPFPSETNHLAQGIGKLKSIAKDYLEMPKIPFPERVKNKGIVHRLESWSESKEFWTDEDFRHVIVTGLVPQKDIAWWSDRLNPKAFAGMDVVTWAAQARPSDILDTLIPLLKAEKDPENRHKVLDTLCNRANEDKSGEMGKIMEKIAERIHEVDKL